jgi:acetyl esterase/lipase
MPDVETINKKILHNGMSRAEYLADLNRRFSQEIKSYPEAEKRSFLNVPYGDKSDQQKINIYLPEGQGPFPVIVFVHGGAWFMGDRSDFGLGRCALPFLKYGYAIVAAGYRLAQEAVHPKPVEDVLAALTLAKKSAARFSLDVTRLGIISGSAGSVIAALAALQDRVVKAVVLRCSIFDFATIRVQFEKIGIRRNRFDYPDEDTSIEALYLGGDIKEMVEACKDANPSNHLLGHIPYFMLEHGLIDSDTPYLQSIEFAQSVKAASGDPDRAECVLLENTGHDNGAYDLPETFERELVFFKRRL